MKAKHSKAPAERVVKDIRRATRKQYSAEEKIRIVLDCQDLVLEFRGTTGTCFSQSITALIRPTLRKSR